MTSSLRINDKTSKQSKPHGKRTVSFHMCSALYRTFVNAQEMISQV